MSISWLYNSSSLRNLFRIISLICSELFWLRSKNGDNIAKISDCYTKGIAVASQHSQRTMIISSVGSQACNLFKSVFNASLKIVYAPWISRIYPLRGFFFKIMFACCNLSLSANVWRCIVQLSCKLDHMFRNEIISRNSFWIKILRDGLLHQKFFSQ